MACEPHLQHLYRTIQCKRTDIPILQITVGRWAEEVAQQKALALTVWIFRFYPQHWKKKIGTSEIDFVLACATSVWTSLGFSGIENQQKTHNRNTTPNILYHLRHFFLPSFQSGPSPWKLLSSDCCLTPLSAARNEVGYLWTIEINFPTVLEAGNCWQAWKLVSTSDQSVCAASTTRQASAPWPEESRVDWITFSLYQLTPDRTQPLLVKMPIHSRGQSSDDSHLFVKVPALLRVWAQSCPIFCRTF